MIQSKGGEQIKGETLDDPQLVELGRGDGRGARPGRPEHGPVLPRGRPDPRHHRHQHPLRRRVPAAAGRGGRLPAMIVAIAAGRAPGAARSARTRPGVVMTRFLDQTILLPRTVGPRPARARGLGSAVVDREITLRDYGRVLWSGRWLILATTVVAAHRRPPPRRSRAPRPTRPRAELFVGQATTVSGTPVATPGHQPRARSTTALTGDNHRGAGSRRRSGSRQRGCAATSRSAPPGRPGGSVGNQPTVITITFKDESREIARKGANAYAAGRLRRGASRASRRSRTSYEKAVATASASVAATSRPQLARYRRQLAATDDRRTQLILQSLLNSAGQQLADRHHRALATSGSTWSRRSSSSPRSSRWPRARARPAASPTGRGRSSSRRCIGFLVGIIVTFVWRGSPAGRAGRE